MANVANVHRQIWSQLLLEIQAELLRETRTEIGVIELHVTANELSVRIGGNSCRVGAQKCRRLVSIRRDQTIGAVPLRAAKDVAVVLHRSVINSVPATYRRLVS